MRENARKPAPCMARHQTAEQGGCPPGGTHSASYPPGASFGGGAYMRRITAVSALAFRAALRTRTVLALLVLLALVVLALPHVIRGDGTPEGALQIRLVYTLTLSFGILCLVTLWAACSLFSAEIDSARIELTVVKPVTPAQLWYGKWLALVALDALMILLVYGGVYAQLRWTIHRGNWSEAQRPASRFVTHPQLPSVQEEARQVYQQWAAEKKLPPKLSKADVLRELANKAPDRYSIISPGERVSWRFAPRRAVRAGDPVQVRMRLDTEFSTSEAVSGRYLLSCTDEGGHTVETAWRDFTQKAIEFTVDSRQLTAATNAPLRNFELVFEHTGDEKVSSAIMTRFRKDVCLLTPGGSFEANLARSALIELGVLAALAALGLTLSACLSLPVAAFTGTLLLLLFVVSDSINTVTIAEERKNIGNRIGYWVSEYVNRAVAFTSQTDPIGALADGERIGDADLFRTMVGNYLVLPALFCFGGAWILRRRELAENSK
ncbi:MAG: hypothetical protein IJR99_06215 [Kiritimatiellae bacterium]|nr:hypothetical protein [Kiritimatiellia bacterium]